MRIRKLTGDAQGLAVLRRQFAYPCVKSKAKKVFLVCSGVCCSAVYLAGRRLKKIGLELKIRRPKAHFLRLKQLNSYKYY